MALTGFSDSGTRSNGQKILYSWFNVLRTAGIALENYIGAGSLPETAFTIANNTGSPANVTGLLFASATAKFSIASLEKQERFLQLIVMVTRRMR